MFVTLRVKMAYFAKMSFIVILLLNKGLTLTVIFYIIHAGHTNPKLWVSVNVIIGT